MYLVNIKPYVICMILLFGVFSIISKGIKQLLVHLPIIIIIINLVCIENNLSVQIFDIYPIH